ncbi:hypothetical protein KSF78_0009722 [Schistosoma japonicum]|nr:hypothetical protein KSF78_0009722 [Schistosoma japonicum]
MKSSVDIEVLFPHIFSIPEDFIIPNSNCSAVTNTKTELENFEFLRRLTDHLATIDWGIYRHNQLVIMHITYPTA